jgi:hypothetical protein
MMSRRFDRRSPRLQEDLAAFRDEVWALEHAVAPHALAIHTRLSGVYLEVFLVPVENGAARVAVGVVGAWQP